MFDARMGGGSEGGGGKKKSAAELFAELNAQSMASARARAGTRSSVQQGMGADVVGQVKRTKGATNLEVDSVMGSMRRATLGESTSSPSTSSSPSPSGAVSSAAPSSGVAASTGQEGTFHWEAIDFGTTTVDEALHRVKRCVNGLSDVQASTRKAALGALAGMVGRAADALAAAVSEGAVQDVGEDAGDAAGERLQALVEEELSRALVKRFGDTHEACRERAVGLMLRLVAGIPDPQPLLPYIVAAGAERLMKEVRTGDTAAAAGSGISHAEPSEEVRRLHLELLRTVCRRCDTGMAPYTADLVNLISISAGDGDPEILIATCALAQALVKAVGRDSELGARTPLMYPTVAVPALHWDGSEKEHTLGRWLAECLMDIARHRRFRVRLAAVHAVADAIMAGGAYACFKLTAWIEPHTVPIQAFYDPSVQNKVNYAGVLTIDGNALVREAFLSRTVDMLLRMVERLDYENRLLPYVAAAIGDEMPHIRLAAYDGLEAIGKLHEEDTLAEERRNKSLGIGSQEEKFKDQLEFRPEDAVDGEYWPQLGLPHPFDVRGRPRLGSRRLVRGLYMRLHKGLVKELTSWTSGTALRTAGLLRTCLAYAEENVSMYIEPTVRAFCQTSLLDEGVGEKVCECAEVVGTFAPPEGFVPVIVPRARGDPLPDASAGLVDETLARARALTVLASLLRGCGSVDRLMRNTKGTGVADRDYLADVFGSVFGEEHLHVWQSRHSELRRAAAVAAKGLSLMVRSLDDSAQFANYAKEQVRGVVRLLATCDAQVGEGNALDDNACEKACQAHAVCTLANLHRRLSTAGDAEMGEAVYEERTPEAEAKAMDVIDRATDDLLASVTPSSTWGASDIGTECALATFLMDRFCATCSERGGEASGAPPEGFVVVMSDAARTVCNIYGEGVGGQSHGSVLTARCGQLTTLMRGILRVADAGQWNAHWHVGAVEALMPLLSMRRSTRGVQAVHIDVLTVVDHLLRSPIGGAAAARAMAANSSALASVAMSGRNENSDLAGRKVASSVLYGVLVVHATAVADVLPEAGSHAWLAECVYGASERADDSNMTMAEEASRVMGALFERCGWAGADLPEAVAMGRYASAAIVPADGGEDVPEGQRWFSQAVQRLLLRVATPDLEDSKELLTAMEAALKGAHARRPRAFVASVPARDSVREWVRAHVPEASA